MPSGVLSGLTWHWTNPAKVEDSQDIYLRYVMYFDNTMVENSYKNLYVRWLDAKPCKSGFIVDSGSSVKVGPKQVFKKKMRLVAALPHVHDHASQLKLMQNGNLLKQFEIAYQYTPVEHDDIAQGEVPWHYHKQHLPANGLHFWRPGQFGVVIKNGDYLQMMASYNNPHQKPIDNMALVIAYFELLP